MCENCFKKVAVSLNRKKDNQRQNSGIQKQTSQKAIKAMANKAILGMRNK